MSQERYTLENLTRYFADVEQAFEDGKMTPLSREGEAVLDELLQTYQSIKAHAADLEQLARRPSADTQRFDEYLDLIDVQRRIVMLLGKWVGFKAGVNFILAKSGSQSQYLL